MTASALAALCLVLLLGAAAALARRRTAREGPEDAPVLRGRAQLSRDAGVAVVRVGTETVLVGFGKDGVRLLARIGRWDAP